LFRRERGERDQKGKRGVDFERGERDQKGKRGGLFPLSVSPISQLNKKRGTKRAEVGVYFLPLKRVKVGVYFLSPISHLNKKWCS
jgi:hypothetical protein